MPKNDHRYHHHQSNHNRYPRRLLYDSEIDDHQPVRIQHSRSRSDSHHSRRSSDSDQRTLSFAFLKDLCGTNSLTELEKAHPKEVAEFRAGLQPPKNYDPYHLTPLPALVLSLDIAEEVRSLQKLRRDVKLEESASLQVAKDSLREAQLKDYEAQARLEAVEEQLKKQKGMESPIKVILIGDSGVGKSCLIIRYCKDVFQPTHYSTIGIDFHHKHVIRPDGSVQTIQVYDTAGQERFRTVSKSFYRQANAIGLVYDNSDAESFKNLTNWLSEVEQICPETKRFILANKSDVDSVIDPAQVSRVAKQADARVFQVSAKTGQNVAEAFAYVTEEVVKAPRSTGTTLNLHPETSSGYCCAL